MRKIVAGWGWKRISLPLTALEVLGMEPVVLLPVMIV